MRSFKKGKPSDGWADRKKRKRNNFLLVPERKPVIFKLLSFQKTKRVRNVEPLKNFSLHLSCEKLQDGNDN